MKSHPSFNIREADRSFQEGKLEDMLNLFGTMPDQKTTSLHCHLHLHLLKDCLKRFKEQYLKVQICLAPAHFNGQLATHALHLSISSMNITNSYWRKVTSKLAGDTYVLAVKRKAEMLKTETDQFSHIRSSNTEAGKVELSCASVVIYHTVFIMWKYKEYRCRTRHTGLFWAVSLKFLN